MLRRDTAREPDASAGRRIAVLAMDGFELVELVSPANAMRLAGASVDVISIHPGHIRGMNLHEPAMRVGVDLTLDEANPNDYDGLLIPGWIRQPGSAAAIRCRPRIRSVLRTDGQTDRQPVPRPLGTGLGRAPRWPASNLRPGLRDDLVNAGATWLDEPLVHDGNLVTSRGPQDMKPFVTAIIRLFAGQDLEPEFPESRATESAPQPQEPPRLVVNVMRWMPKPSVRTVLGIAAVAAGIRFTVETTEPGGMGAAIWCFPTDPKAMANPASRDFLATRRSPT